ncbi:MAG TPA: tetratricopeptide repeat protein [Vicinamibacterales bacterium]|nr:tetratricopeptide repeat protein [Vicinamibacterales bacterium]
MTEVPFGPFVLHASETRLLRDGAEVRLRPQAFHALRVLLQHSGRSIAYEQMIAEAWEGTFVSRHTVDVTVGEVRRCLGEYGRWITHRPKVGYCLEVPASDELVRKGWHFWNRRTREGADRAIECFKQAAAECPGDFRAWDGLSTCYLMLATFGMRSPRDVYREFLAAHERAVEVGGLRPELRCNRAHGLHMYERRYTEAEAEFLQTLQEKPTFGTACVRMALLYATLGRLDEAIEVLDRAYQVDPLLPTLPAAAVNVRVWKREFDTAIDVGRKAVELHPYLQISRANYALALECSGQLDEALAQYQLGSVMSPDLPWMRALEGRCLAKLDRLPEARTILEALDELRRSDYVDAYHMAIFRDALGQRDEAFAELERACEENSAFLYSIDLDPRIDALRADPRFAAVRKTLGI